MPRSCPRGRPCSPTAGLTGPVASAIGMDPENVIARFRTALPHRFTVARTPPEFQGALLDVDAATGKAVQIAAWRFAP